MGRAWRIEYEGALYHVMSRGNDQKAVFLDDKDRRTFLNVIEAFWERFDVDIFAYVLMPNHYHLLLKTNLGNLSKAMHWLGTTFTGRFNKRHSRSGHLFQGRFKSIIVENDAYMLQLSCYIHRNPLKSGLVKRLVDYPWSSYPIYAYGKRAPEWLTTKVILAQFKDPNPHKAYREKVQQYAGEERKLVEELQHGFIVGSKDFVEKIRAKYLPEKPGIELPQQRKVAGGFDVEVALSQAAAAIGWDFHRLKKLTRIRGSDKENRDLLIYFLWNTGVLTNERIGRIFGLTYSSVSHAVKEVQSKLSASKELREKYRGINSQFKV